MIFEFCDFGIVFEILNYWIFDYRQIWVPRDFFLKTISDSDLDFSGNNFVMISVRHVHGRAGGANDAVSASTQVHLSEASRVLRLL